MPNSSNTVFKIYNDEPLEQCTITVLNGLKTIDLERDCVPLNYETQVSGQFSEIYGPKDPDDILATFNADDANLPSSNNAALISVNDYDFLAFDDASTETVYFDGVMPENYTGKNIQVRLGWTNETGVGNVMWLVDLAHLTGANNLFDTTYLPGVSGLDTAPSVSGSPQEMLLQMEDYNLGNLARVEDYRLRVRRVGGVSSDTMGGDAYLLNVSLEELY